MKFSFIVWHRHFQAFLFNKPEACPSDRSQELCEEVNLIYAVNIHPTRDKIALRFGRLQRCTRADALSPWLVPG